MYLPSPLFSLNCGTWTEDIGNYYYYIISKGKKGWVDFYPSKGEEETSSYRSMWWWWLVVAAYNGYVANWIMLPVHITNGFTTIDNWIVASLEWNLCLHWNNSTSLLLARVIILSHYTASLPISVWPCLRPWGPCSTTNQYHCNAPNWSRKGRRWAMSNWFDNISLKVSIQGWLQWLKSFDDIIETDYWSFILIPEECLKNLLFCLILLGMRWYTV